MRRLLRASSILCLVIGAALWFFGGMNTGPSQWTEEVHAADGTLVIESSPRHVFRPGLRFLAGTGFLSLSLWIASLKASPPPGRTTGPNP